MSRIVLVPRHSTWVYSWYSTTLNFRVRRLCLKLVMHIQNGLSSFNLSVTLLIPIAFVFSVFYSPSLECVNWRSFFASPPTFQSINDFFRLWFLVPWDFPALITWLSFNLGLRTNCLHFLFPSLHGVSVQTNQSLPDVVFKLVPSTLSIDSTGWVSFNSTIVSHGRGSSIGFYVSLWFFLVSFSFCESPDRHFNGS